MYYDPMIAKLVTYGEDRNQAIEAMQHALDEYYIRGVSHNISFLNALMVHPRFIKGDLTTNFIAEEFPDGFNAEMVAMDDLVKPVVVAAIIHRNNMDRAAKLSGQVPGHERYVHNDWGVIINDEIHLIDVVKKANQKNTAYEVQYEGETYTVETDWVIGEPLFQAKINNEKACFQVQREGLWYQLYHRGARTDVLVTTPANARLQGYMLKKEPPDLSKLLLSPMPGLLMKMVVTEGMEVKAGEELVIIEAMKMENVLRAEQDGVIAKIKAEVGDSLMVDQVIIEFE